MQHVAGTEGVDDLRGRHLDASPTSRRSQPSAPGQPPRCGPPRSGPRASRSGSEPPVGGWKAAEASSTSTEATSSGRPGFHDPASSSTGMPRARAAAASGTATPRWCPSTRTARMPGSSASMASAGGARPASGPRAPRETTARSPVERVISTVATGSSNPSPATSTISTPADSQSARTTAASGAAPTAVTSRHGIPSSAEVVAALSAGPPASTRDASATTFSSGAGSRSTVCTTSTVASPQARAATPLRRAPPRRARRG